MIAVPIVTFLHLLSRRPLPKDLRELPLQRRRRPLGVLGAAPVHLATRVPARSRRGSARINDPTELERDPRSGEEEIAGSRSAAWVLRRPDTMRVPASRGGKRESGVLRRSIFSPLSCCLSKPFSSPCLPLSLSPLRTQCGLCYDETALTIFYFSLNCKKKKKNLL